METWEAIATRRNVRRFADRAIEQRDLDRIADAARLAPSSMNEQRWAFVVCTDREHLKQLARTGDYANHLAGAAAAIAFLSPRAHRESALIAFDLGQAVENAMIAAWDLGIGSCHASVYDEDLARKLLGYPEELRCDLLISLGYPARPMGPPGSRGGRRPFNEVVHRERYSG